MKPIEKKFLSSLIKKADSLNIDEQGKMKGGFAVSPSRKKGNEDLSTPGDGLLACC
jgi:hypothetical protein